MTLTLQELKIHLARRRSVPYSRHDIACYRREEKERLHEGSRFTLDASRIHDGMLEVSALPLDTKFQVYKVKVDGWMRIPASYRFIVCVGRISEDVWFIKQECKTMIEALSFWRLEYEEIEQAWSVMLGKPIALSWMTSPA